jgi:hypothetical protein
LLEGLNSQGCQKLICGYGDVLGYKAQVLKILEEKQELLFLEAIQVLLVFEAQVD